MSLEYTFDPALHRFLYSSTTEVTSQLVSGGPKPKRLIGWTELIYRDPDSSGNNQHARKHSTSISSFISGTVNAIAKMSLTIRQVHTFGLILEECVDERELHWDSWLSV
jgi:hypothetical protein